MSTTNTSTDPEGTPRRARLPRPLRRLNRSGAGRGRAHPAPEGVQRLPLAVQTRQENAVRAAGRRRGRKAAKARVLDPWILGSGDRVPYFAELASVRDHLHARMAVEHADAEARTRARDAVAARAGEDFEEEVRRLDARLTENADWLETNRAQLDRLAARAVRWEHFRDGVREQLERRWLTARFGDLGLDEDPPGPGRTDGRPDHRDEAGDPEPAAGAPDTGPPGPGEPDDDGWQVVDPEAVGGTTADRKPADGAAADPLRTGSPYALAREQREQVDITRWEGLPVRPGLPRWMVWCLLLVIAAVEVPIYWIAFQPFHGTGNTKSESLSGTLAVSAALVMVIVPHLAGRALRGRSGTGAARRANLPALGLLAVWAFSTWALGHLRAKLVFRHRESPLADQAENIPGLENLRTPSLIDSLHLSTTTVTWMFVALLVLSGGIGLLLGLLREHPYLDAYRSHLELRARLERDRAAAVTAGERARALQETAEDRARLRGEAHRSRTRATTELYEATAHAFLMGVVEGSADPAVTEAAMRLSNTWPLLPFPAVRV
ncbi:hypothetical protein [Streptomyces sp. NPDC089919]|uniref:hypothetical protein n=1 Tax=Streptomyces sp. NPDC089919 TaxID=3155188 RepID=UPI00343C61CB